MRIGPVIFTRDVVSTQDNAFFLLFESGVCHLRGHPGKHLWKTPERRWYCAFCAKGVSLMTLVSLADGCRLLAIDSKTLHRWLERSHLCVQQSPLDARLKCVTLDQLQQVAAVHHRILSEWHALPSDVFSLTPSTSPMSGSAVACAGGNDDRHPCDLSAQLADLQTRITALQHQLAFLTEQVQQERKWRMSSEKLLKNKSLGSSQDKSLGSSQDKSLESSQDKSLGSSQDKSLKSSQDKSLKSSQDKSLKSSQDKSLKSSQDRRKHPHVLSLVEYGMQGTYVVISPEQGMLSFQPDSPEWFAWLETLPSFRFVGQHGRFTAFRGYQCSPSTPWWAHRNIRNHSHKQRIGTTPSMTIASLELAATSLQALVK
jgi:hypothetical protein